MLQKVDKKKKAAPKKESAGGKDAGKGKGKKDEPAKTGKEYFLTTQSQSLDLTSPAGEGAVNRGT